MKRLLLGWMLVVGGAGGIVWAAHAKDDHVAMLENVLGNIDIARKDATLGALSGTTLFVSDRVISGTGASANIVFKDGTQLTVGPSTDIQVREFAFEPIQEKYGFFVYLARGAAIYLSGMIARMAPDEVKVGTPTATVGVRGTRFIIEAD